MADSCSTSRAAISKPHMLRCLQVLQPNDILWFSGDIDGILTLRKTPGIRPHVQSQEDRLPDRAQEVSSELLVEYSATVAPLAALFQFPNKNTY